MANIITLDAGFKNGRLEPWVEDLRKSGQWKKQRIVYIIPGGQTINSRVYLSHRGLIFPPNQSMYPMFIENAEVGAAYEAGIQAILEHPELSTWEYVLTIEADNIPPPDGVLKLIRRMEDNPHLSCIGGLYWTKQESGVPQIWGDIKDPVVNYRPQMPEPGKVVECCGTGMGFNLWRMEMFRELKRKGMERPWFKTVAGPNGIGTQDLYFWEKARKMGFRCGVDCDTLVGHMDTQTGIIW